MLFAALDYSYFKLTAVLHIGGNVKKFKFKLKI